MFQYPTKEQFIAPALSSTLKLFDDLLDWRSKEDGTMLTRCGFALSTSGWGRLEWLLRGSLTWGADGSEEKEGRLVRVKLTTA